MTGLAIMGIPSNKGAPPGVSSVLFGGTVPLP